jgi:hypothetical protein
MPAQPKPGVNVMITYFRDVCHFSVKMPPFLKTNEMAQFKQKIAVL